MQYSEIFIIGDIIGDLNVSGLKKALYKYKKYSSCLETFWVSCSVIKIALLPAKVLS